jgi:PIN domain nuclease of toxin-antitoxin system
MGIRALKALLDTHAVIWAAEGDTRLGVEAQKILKVCANKEAAISDITLFEIAMLADKNRIQLSISVAEYLEGLQRIYTVIPIAGRIAAEAVSLSLPQGDPFDRIIVASARYHQLPLISRDRKIQESALVQIIW